MIGHERLNRAALRLSEFFDCSPDDFFRDENRFITTDKTAFRFATFGKGAVIASTGLTDALEQKFASVGGRFIMEGDGYAFVDSLLRERGFKVWGEAMRFLFDGRSLDPPDGFACRILDPSELVRLFARLDGLGLRSAFSNAFNYRSDVLACALFDDDMPVCISGADDIWGDMWQVGIDTLPAYRSKGLAAYAVNRLALEIEAAGKLPFYTTWSLNIASLRTAAASGFLPVWTEYLSKAID